MSTPAALPDAYHVIGKYACTPRYVQPLGSVYKVVADEGVYALKYSDVPRERLIRIADLLRKVRREGYPNLLPLVRSKEGEEILSAAQGSWYMTPWQSSLATERPLSATVLARSLARLHRTAAELAPDYPELTAYADEEMLEGWNKQRKRWERAQVPWKEEGPGGKHYALWQSYYEKVDQAFAFALRGMEKFLTLETGKPPRTTLCHRRIHGSNVVQGETNFYWLDFDNSCLDSPVRDLALLMRRYTPDCIGGAEPHRLLEVYEKEWKLRPKEKKLLAIYLAYPERVLKRMRRQQRQEERPLPAAYTLGYPMQEEPSSSDHPTMRTIWQAELHHLEQLQTIARSLWSVRSRLSGR